MQWINNINLKKMGILSIFFLLFSILGFQKLAFYVRFDFNFILLLIVFPFVVRKYNNQRSLRFGLLALLLFALYPFVKLSSVYFLAFVCSLFFLYEGNYGKLTSIPLFLILVVSPVALFLSEIVGFEIRLYLTKVAVKILQLINPTYSAQGNIIYQNNNEFHVDPECMGLKMVIISMFIALVFISVHQQKSNRIFPFYSVLLILFFTYALVVFSNLFRIILITVFMVEPDTLGHELVGLICLIIYVIVPLWYVIPKLPQKVKLATINKESLIHPKLNAILTFAILTFLIVFRFTHYGEKSAISQEIQLTNIKLDGFDCSVEDHGVLKYTNDQFLVYVKPAVGFYSADHSPIICWKGSGYKVKKEQILNLDGQKVYYSELQQNDDLLYSVWWYDSGEDKTISQFKWRLNSLLQNKKYNLINVISGNRNLLVAKSKEMIFK